MPRPRYGTSGRSAVCRWDRLAVIRLCLFWRTSAKTKSQRLVVVGLKLRSKVGFAIGLTPSRINARAKRAREKTCAACSDAGRYWSAPSAAGSTSQSLRASAASWSSRFNFVCLRPIARECGGDSAANKAEMIPERSEGLSLSGRAVVVSGRSLIPQSIGRIPRLISCFLSGPGRLRFDLATLKRRRWRGLHQFLPVRPRALRARRSKCQKSSGARRLLSQ